MNVVKKKFKILPIYQIKDYMLLQIKEKKLLINLSQSWIKHELYTHTQMDTNVHWYVCVCIYIYIYIYIYTHTHTHRNIISKK